MSASYPPGRSGGGGNQSKQSECPTEASHTCSTPFSVLRHSHHHAISIKIQYFCYNLTIRLRDFTLPILIEGLNCKRIPREATLLERITAKGTNQTGTVECDRLFTQSSSKFWLPLLKRLFYWLFTRLIHEMDNVPSGVPGC